MPESGPVIPLAVRESIEAIVGRYWGAAKQCYVSSDAPPGHVFLDLQRVRDWLHQTKGQQS